MSNGMLFDTPSVDPKAAWAGAASPGTTQSLYRKYRPTSFADDDLVGQDHVVHTLRNSIALGRVSHAYLFCGPRGTGKTTTARLMAKAVNCLNPDPHARPCNECTACVAINANATTDVIEIDAASNRGIDDIRDLRERVKYAPTQLRTKFYIIDEAHQITGAAANAFLKTLEEPPPHTRFILATTDPEELLATIVSRCQRFDFRRISVDAMVARLRTVADREQIAIEEDALPVIARQATGSLRDALGMLDQLAVYRSTGDETDEPISAELARSVLGISRNERIETLARSLAERDATSGLREVSAAVDAGDDIRQLGKQLVAYLRELMLVKAGSTSHNDPGAVEMAERFSLDDLARLVRGMVDLDFRSKRATLPQLPLAMAIVEGVLGANQASASSPERRAVAAAPVGRTREVAEASPPDDEYLPEPAPAAPRVSLRDRVRGVSSPPAGSPRRPPSDAQPAQPIAARPEPSQRFEPEPEARTQPAEGTNPGRTANSNPLSVEGLVELWPKIRADVKATNRRIEALLQMVDPAAVVGNQIILVSPYEFHRNRINTDDVRTVIEGVITRLLSTQVLVRCVPREEVPSLGGSSAPSVPDSPRQDPPRSIREETPNGRRDVAPAGNGSDQPAPPEVVDSLVEQRAKDDEQRIRAAQNIFDAEEILDD